jgi:hypothetical protein
MLVKTDEDIRKVDDEIAHDKKIKEKAKRRQNKLREIFRKLANREKRYETCENVLDMKAHITYDSLHKEEIRMYGFGLISSISEETDEIIEATV